MSPTQQGQFVQPPAHDAEQQGAAAHREASSAVPSGNDNSQHAAAVDELIHSRQRIWQRFARGLIIGGLLWAIGLIGLLAFIYSRYP